MQVRCNAYLGLAIPPEQDPQYREFVEEVSKQLMASLGVERLEPALTDRPWEVYLYIVAYAFPTPTLPIVRECSQAYRDVYRAIVDEKQQFPVPLHLSTAWEGRLEDLEIYEPELARGKKGAREILLFGSVLKVLRVTMADGGPVYSYTTGAPLWQQKKLGPRRDAEDAIAAHEGLRSMLLQAISAMEGALDDTQLLAYYWVLQYQAADPDMLPGQAG